MQEPATPKFNMPKFSRPVLLIVISVAVAVFGFIFIRAVSRYATNKISTQMRDADSMKGNQLPDVPGYQKLTIEKEMERRVQNVMDEVVGPRKSIVRVTVDLTSEIKDNEEIYTPKALSTKKEEKYTVSSERGTAENAPENQARNAAKKNDGPALPGGFDDIEKQVRPGEEYFVYPGYPSMRDLEARPVGRGAQIGKNQEKEGTRSVREASSLDYALDKKITETLTPAGSINRISVFVLVDVVWKKTFSGKLRRILRSEKDITDIRFLIENAVGFNEQRGDRIEIKNIAFEGTRPATEMMERITLGITILVLLPLIYFIVKTTMNFLRRRAEARQEILLKMQQEEEADKERKEKEDKEQRERIQMHQEQVFTIGRTHPDICARIVRNWLT